LDGRSRRPVPKTLLLSRPCRKRRYRHCFANCASGGRAEPPIVPSIDPEQVHQIALDLAALRQTVEQLAAGQDQTARVIDRLQGAVAEILIKIQSRRPPPIAAPARKPKPIAPPSSQAPLPLH
jgi:hypothetical protein